MSEVVLKEVHDDGVAVLTLNRPERRNALSLGLMRELTAALRTLGADRWVRVVILRSTGPAFSAGVTRLASPSSAASRPSTTRPESSRSSARAGPTRRGRIHEMPCSATSPRRANAVVSFAFSATKRTSHISACTSPMPAHGPLIAAITGLGTLSVNVCGVCSSWAGAAPLPTASCPASPLVAAPF